jgi:hypothetical protein
MRRAVPVVVLLLTLALVSGLTGCGGTSGVAKDAGRRRFLLVVHSPMAGAISARSDTDLVALGQQACAALGAHQSSDEVVTTMAGDALPGSAEYNSYSFLVVSAASDLCPDHAADFKGTIPTGP